MHIGLKAAPLPQIRRPQGGGASQPPRPTQRALPPTLAPILGENCHVRTGGGGSGRYRHCRGSAQVPQASVPYQVPARHRVPTPLPSPCSGLGRGRGQAAGSLFPQPERSGGGKRSAPPSPAQAAPRATTEPTAQEGVVGRGPSGKQGPVRRNLAREDRERLWVERGARSFPGTPALRLPAAGGLEAT